MVDPKRLGIYCEKCEIKMTILGESYMHKRRRNKFEISEKRWYVIWKCLSCNRYKEIPREE